MHVILAIDDETSTLNLIEAQLAGKYYRVFTESSSVKGIEVSKSLNPNLILLDYFMPDIDGLSVLKALRKDSITREIPVIMLTANTNRDDIVQLMRYHIIDYLVKPYEVENLLGKVKAAIQYGDLKRRERDSDQSDKIAVTFDQETILVSFRANLGNEKLIQEVKKVFTPYFFKRAADLNCVIDLRSIDSFDEPDIEILKVIIVLFSDKEVQIVAGRHYGTLVAHIDFLENMNIFISFGDMEVYIASKEKSGHSPPS